MLLCIQIVHREIFAILLGEINAKMKEVCVYVVEVDYNVNDCELWIRVSRSCIDIRRELLTYQCTIMVLVGEQP